MPYKANYNSKTVSKGGSRTPESVMGGQGSSAKIPQTFYKSKPTTNKKFPQ